MIIARDIETVRKTVRQYHEKNESIAIVTTMGNLHTGHITLVKEAEKLADHTVATVFVNPLQFNNKNDLKTYPRTPEADLKKLEDAGVDMVFMPTPEIMYPEGMDVQTTVNVPHISEILEGAMRPGHFRGVATVVLKLFNIVTPDYCMFGQKDYQQVALLKKMIRDLSVPVEMHVVPTVRMESGLAFSSRNGLLTEDELKIAPHLYETISSMKKEIEGGRRDFAALIKEGTEKLNSFGFKTDAIDIVNADTLEAPDTSAKKLVILAEAYLGKPRLIDNIEVNI